MHVSTTQTPFDQTRYLYYFPKQDSSVPRHTIYQMARLFSSAGDVIAENVIHDYTAVLYAHGHINKQNS